MFTLASSYRSGTVHTLNVTQVPAHTAVALVSQPLRAALILHDRFHRLSAVVCTSEESRIDQACLLPGCMHSRCRECLPHSCDCPGCVRLPEACPVQAESLWRVQSRYDACAPLPSPQQSAHHHSSELGTGLSNGRPAAPPVTALVPVTTRPNMQQPGGGAGLL